MWKKTRSAYDFVTEVLEAWNDDNCFRLSAALSYYTLFSIAPLVVVVIATAGYFLGEQAISGAIFNKVYTIIGDQAASGLQTLVRNAYVSKPTSLSGFVSVAVLLFSATVVMTALQSSLNTILNVRIRADKGILYFVISRLLALVMLLVIGVLLVATIVLNAVWIAISDYMGKFLPDSSYYVIEAGQLVISLGMTTLLFALMYKYLPDAKIRWRNIWIGSLTTSILFLVGRYLISFYLGNTNITSLYGAAGSVILLIVWINYSSWIFFLGAEVIHVVSNRKGDRIIPSRIAESYREVVEMQDSWN
ncbi:MAG TPA: YihY/virulence factor BrkB family protein [Catalimonadaceae bacterium]|nr:YihY/virulence factor BrkB family protein [Catalimonadaceae bacterium]